jgi:hypothetical protein
MKSITVLLAAVVCLQAFGLHAQDKAILQEPKEPDLFQKLSAEPDGVLSVKTNDDGSFKSLFVKATVDIEDVLGAQKGKQLARQEAGIQCKRYLSQWLNEDCVFVEGSNSSVTIVTKGESAKDAAGNTIKLRSQQGQESKMLSESYASFSEATLKGLTAVASEISEVSKAGQSFTLVMDWTQKSINQATAVANALSGTTPKPSKSDSEADRPDPETKVNPDALND